ASTARATSRPCSPRSTDVPRSRHTRGRARRRRIAMVSTTLPATPAAPARRADAARLPLYDRTLTVRRYELLAEAVEALPPEELLGARLAFVAAPPSAGLPSDRVVLRVTDVAAAESARAAGYAVAVDSSADEALVVLASVVRVDAGALDEAELATIV